jgi:hypothetical protein
MNMNREKYERKLLSPGLGHSPGICLEELKENNV